MKVHHSIEQYRTVKTVAIDSNLVDYLGGLTIYKLDSN